MPTRLKFETIPELGPYLQELVADLGPGEYYDIRETAREVGASDYGLRQAAEKIGALVKLRPAGERQSKVYLANPKHLPPPEKS